MKTNNNKIPRHFSPAEGEVASHFKPQKIRFSFSKTLRKWLSPLFFLVLNFVTTDGTAQSIEQLSLEEFLKMVTQQNIAAQQAQLDIKQADWNYKLYRAGLKPNLTASANFPNFARTFSEIIQPDGTIQFQPIRNNNSRIGLSLVQNIPQTGGTVFLNSGLQRFDDFENKSKLYNGNPIQVGLYQPLFGFNSMKWDKKLEPIKQAEAQKKFNVDLLAIQTTATTLFFDLLVADQEAEIAKNNEENNQQLFEIAEERLSLGRISKGDLKQLQLELISAQQSRRRAEQAVFYASAAIYDFLGHNYNEETIQPVFPEELSKDVIDPTTALQKALTNHHDPISQQRMLLEVNRDLEKAKRETGLQVDINASFGLVRSSKKVSEIYSDPQQEQFAQLQLTVPILDWGARKAQVGIARAQRDFTERSVAQQKRTFETTVRQTAEEVNFLIQDLELTESIQKIALERFEIAKESYVLGSISITELTLAQREKDQAQRQYTRTVREYWEARGRLAGFVGSIN